MSSYLRVIDCKLIACSGHSCDLYNLIEDVHEFFEIPATNPVTPEDCVIDVCNSPDKQLIAFLMCLSKRVLVYNVNTKELLRTCNLPRAASKVRFTPDSSCILIADKTGDALMYNLNEDHPNVNKLFGHLSLLLDILMTPDKEFIITCDRDEKIRVTSYPNTYHIHSYCLGHKEFVKCLEMFPCNENFIVSASGDGTVKIWDYKNGRNCLTIDTKEYVETKDIQSFIETMDLDGIEVNALPIIYMDVVSCDEKSVLIAISVHKINSLLLFKIEYEKLTSVFKHSFLSKVKFDQHPSFFQLSDNKIFVTFDLENFTNLCIYEFKIVDDEVVTEIVKTIKLFENKSSECDGSDEKINLLFKRKFDNVQEYQEKKRQRMEKNVLN